MISHFGTFDVANYGDLLFPLVLEKRIEAAFGPQSHEPGSSTARAAWGIRHVSPFGGSPPIPGGVECIGVPGLEGLPKNESDKHTGVILGGGHLIHASPTNVSTYRSSPDFALNAYPSLWLGAAHHALSTGAPLIWNAPGIPAELPPDASRLLCWATSFCDYVSVRDERSLRLLQRAGFEGEAHVAPDTAFDIAHLFSDSEIDLAYRAAFEARNLPPAQATISFHLNERYLGEEPGLVAQRIDQICAQADSTAILIGLGPCHGDDDLAVEVGAAMRNDVLVIDQPRTLIEAAACIARSRAYIGSSLHGAITACAFGVPAMIVAKESADGGKFSGFLGPHGLESWLVADWAEAEAKSPALLGCAPEPWRVISRQVGPALDRHWRKIETTLRESPRHSRARADAPLRLLETTQEIISSGGIYAGLRPEQARLAVSQQNTIKAQRQHARELKASYRAANRDLRRKIAALETPE